MSQEQRMAESLIWVKRVNALREAMDKAMQRITGWPRLIIPTRIPVTVPPKRN